MPPKPQVIRNIRQHRGKLLQDAWGSLLVEKLNELPVVDLEVTPIPDHATARSAHRLAGCDTRWQCPICQARHQDNNRQMVRFIEKNERSKAGCPPPTETRARWP